MELCIMMYGRRKFLQPTGPTLFQCGHEYRHSRVVHIVVGEHHCLWGMFWSDMVQWLGVFTCHTRKSMAIFRTVRIHPVFSCFFGSSYTHVTMVLFTMFIQLFTTFQSVQSHENHDIYGNMGTFAILFTMFIQLIHWPMVNLSYPPHPTGEIGTKKSSATVRPPWDLRWCPKCRPAQHIVPASAPWCVAPLHHRSPCLGQTPGPRGSSPGRPRKGMAGESEKSEGIWGNLINKWWKLMKDYFLNLKMMNTMMKEAWNGRSRSSMMKNDEE